jgi:hypothetical protein
VSNYITIDEQEARGLRRPAQNHPEHFITPYRQGDITATEHGVIASSLSAAGTVMAHRQMSHLARSDDTALTNAFASLFYSLAYSIAGALITGGILLLAYSLLGGEEGLYVIAWFVLWGVCLLGALAYNRWQGLWFSPAGLDHHEIDSRERIAMHAIDKHIELIERRWRIRDS